MITDIADAFGCFILAVGIISAVALHLSVLSDESAPTSVIAYISAATLIGWTGSYKTLFIVGVVFRTALLWGAYELGLTYTIAFMILILIVCVIIMQVVKIKCPVVKGL